AEVTATDGHPFWVPELGEWLDATDLQPGQWLRTSAGTHVQITAIERWTSLGATVHNLTVGNTHTYYVLAEATPVLVHNCPARGGATPGQIGDRGADQLESDVVAQGHTVVGREVHARIPGTRHAKGNYRKYDLVTMKDGYIYLHESKNGPGANYEPHQKAMDDLFTETGLILYGRYARRGGIAGYLDPSRFVINVVHQDV
ncbi:polymorphic toxin-type HINT domain-containing protein, partial [Streptomyces althioticus]|uniref:polymorphic toxin-type HINT domain-containing protein n=1 Tax=Streptomyces althioticus TaxID=83380 RepID=UPI0036FD3B66